MIAEVALTFCLAGLIYIEGEFSTLLAIIIGNRLYSESLKELTNKSLHWYTNQYNVKLADRYNHVHIFPFRTTKKFILPAIASLGFIKTSSS